MKSCKTAWALPMSALAVVFVATVTGCATTPVPADKLARTQALVDSAEQARAEAEPRSAVHLQAAKEQLKSARNLMKDGDNGAADWVLQRAEADAEAALALGHAHIAKADAERTLEAIRRAMAMMQSGGKGS